MARVGGITYIRKNGKLLSLGESELTFNLGHPKREVVMGSSGPLGFTAKAQIAYSEGELIHTQDLDLQDILATENATITHELYNGKTLILHQAYFAGEGDFTSEGKFKFRFESTQQGELIHA